MYICRFIMFALILSVMVIIGGCLSANPSVAAQPSAGSLQASLTTRQLDQPAGSAEMLTMSVDSLSPGAVLPEVYTCEGSSESPAISWDGIPAGSKSLVLILDDPDAPAGTFTHWIVYNIPPKTGKLASAQPYDKVLSNGAQQGETSARSRGYYPPCPPIGSTHRYIFRLYALDMDITQPTADRVSIDEALKGHTIALTEFSTRFGR